MRSATLPCTREAVLSLFVARICPTDARSRWIFRAAPTITQSTSVLAGQRIHGTANGPSILVSKDARIFLATEHPAAWEAIMPVQTTLTTDGLVRLEGFFRVEDIAESCLGSPWIKGIPEWPDVAMLEMPDFF
jgi:hypothetical protein